MWATMLVGSVAFVAILAASQEGAQQSYQNMTAAQRAAATRAFLGLGAVPDKAAAARGVSLFVKNCAFCHGQTAHGATGPSLITSDFSFSTKGASMLSSCARPSDIACAIAPKNCGVASGNGLPASGPSAMRVMRCCAQ